MTYFLYGVFFLSCLVLIIVVLLQPGKTDAGALFTSNISSNAFGSRGTATILSKTTIITATIFMLSALMLSMPALNGGVSVLSSNPEAPAETTAPAANANVDTNQPGVNANNAVQVPPITNLNSETPANSATNTANTSTNTSANKPANAPKANTTNANK